MATTIDQSITSPILVGRIDELQRIHHSIDLSRAGQGKAVLVSGEAGIGKSRLLAEAKTYAVRNGFSLFQMTCYQTDSSSPYAPFSDLLRSVFVNTFSTYNWAELDPLTQELSLLLPELIPLSASSPPLMIDPEQKKRRLFAALIEFFVRTITRQPVLLIIEDVHWSDESSLELLYSLSLRSITQPFLLLITYRSDEVSRSLRHWLAQVDRQHLAHEIMLKPLSRDEVELMLQAIFRNDRFQRSDFIDMLHALTEGNPFFIEEVLKSLVATGEIYLADGIWERKPIRELHIPRSVQDAVYLRSEQLSKTGREVIYLAAVIGRHFDFELLRALTHYSDAKLLVLMKEFIAAQLIVEETVERFVFRHALTRQALYNHLLARERKSLHQSIAESIEMIYASNIDWYIADLSYHYYEADLWEKALDYSILAGEKAQSLYALRPAIEHFTRAFEASGHLTVTPPLSLYRARGQTYEMLGELKHARSDLEALLQNAQMAQDRHYEWQALLDLGALSEGRDYTETGVYYQRAFDLAHEISDARMLADSLNHLGNWHLNAERPLEAHEHHQQALSIFQEIGDPKGVAETLDLLGMAGLLGSNLVESSRYFKQSVEQFSILGNRQRLIFSLSPMPLRGPTFQTDTMVSSATTLTEAAQEGELALKIAREIGHRSGEAFAMIGLALCLGSMGEYDRAIRLLQDALAIAQEIDHRQWITYANIVLGAVYLDILAFPLSEQCLKQALALAQETHSLHWLRTAAGFLTLCYIGQGQFDLAHALLDEVLDPELPMQTLGQRMMWRARAELTLAQEHGALALQSVERLLTSAFNYSSGTVIPRLSKIFGDALFLLHQHDDAESELMKARAVAVEQGALPLVWRVDISLTRLCEQQARLDEAQGYAKSALSLIDSLATQLPEALRESYRRQALELLPHTQAFIRQIARPSALHELTAREREVTVLIALGKTNRQIAQQLVVTERTAETHIRNIFSKLNMTSRSQVALWAVEAGLITPRNQTRAD